MVLYGGYKPQRIRKSGTSIPFLLTGPLNFSSENTPLNSANVINVSIRGSLAQDSAGLFNKIRFVSHIPV